MPLQSNYTSYETPRFRKLSDDQTERLHHASLEILDRTGVCLYEPEALALLQKKGLKVEEGNRVRIPPGLVEWALSIAPKRAVICDRNGRRAMPLERNNVFYGPGSDCPNVIDVRPANAAAGRCRTWRTPPASAMRCRTSTSSCRSASPPTSRPKPPTATRCAPC